VIIHIDDFNGEEIPPEPHLMKKDANEVNPIGMRRKCILGRESDLLSYSYRRKASWTPRLVEQLVDSIDRELELETDTFLMTHMSTRKRI
jgi:hypothetical protein